MVTTTKVNLATVKTTVIVARENLNAAVNPRVKWREQKADLARCSKNLFSLQQKYAVLTTIEARNPRPKERSSSHLGISEEGWLESIFERENTLETHFPWRFSPKLKEKGQESKLYLGFLYLWSIFLHFWV